MTRSRHITTIALALTAFAPPSLQLAGGIQTERTPQVMSDFDGDWSERWMPADLNRPLTRYSVVQDDGNAVLRADSDRSASAIWREVNLRPGASGSISWRWKVQRTVPDNLEEREKKGDDYAARVFVVFGAQPFSRKAQALCYVWAASEPIGSVYPNPYYSRVQTIVLQSGDERAGQWIVESRDFVSDYREYFGVAPDSLTGIAIMSDTDNTGTSTTAWFDDITLNTQ